MEEEVLHCKAKKRKAREKVQCNQRQGRKITVVQNDVSLGTVREEASQ